MAIPEMYAQAEVVVPSDGTNFVKGLCRAIYVGGTGNVAAIMNGSSVVFVGVPAGTILRIQATRVNSTNTTATSMVALY